MAALVLAAVAALATACSLSPSPLPTHTEPDAAWVCPDPVSTALPTWAADGFGEPPPHLVSAHNQIVAVTFGWPLHAPEASPGRANKILWLARTGSGPLRIDAQEQQSGRTISVTLPDGPGPSLVDMPQPGCWRFILTWADNRDEVFVRYFTENA